MGSRKIHKLPEGCKGVIVNIAFLNCVLRAIMEVLGKGRDDFPIDIWKIIMTEHAAINMPSLPVIRKTT